MTIKIPTAYKKKPISAHGLLMKNKISEFLKKGMLKAQPKKG